MKSKIFNKKYWYSVEMNTTLRRTKTTFGMIGGNNTYNAMQRLENLVHAEHNGKMIGCRLHEVDTETGERSEEPCLVMSNVTTGGSAVTVGTRAKSSHVCEDYDDDDDDKDVFGAGWARRLPSPAPVIKLRLKETPND